MPAGLATPCWDSEGAWNELHELRSYFVVRIGALVDLRGNAHDLSQDDMRMARTFVSLSRFCQNSIAYMQQIKRLHESKPSCVVLFGVVYHAAVFNPNFPH
jgi:hypothetical protein